MCLCAAAGASAGVASIVRRRASGDGAANVSAMAARCISSASSRSIPRARVATPRRRRFASTSLFKKVRFGRENRDDSYRNTDLLKAIFCAFFDATVGVAHSETVDIDGGAAAMERASAARARERLRRAFAAMRLEAVENEDDYAVYLAGNGLDALARDGTAVIVTSAAVPACAAFLGDLELLRLALELGYEWNWATCCCAALNGHLECLKYARERGCDWSHLTCEFAAYSGNLECLKYAHERGCPWDEETCKIAAENGHLECLKYAHEHGCPWNEETCACAAYTGHLGCLKYGRMVHGVDVESHASTSGPTRSASARTHALRSRTGLPFSQCSATHAHPLSSTYASRCTPSIDSSPHAGLLTWIYAPGGVKKRVSHPRARSANASPRR